MAWNGAGKGIRSPFRKTTDQIIEEFKKVHGDLFLYDKVDYVNSDTKVSIGCRQHGYFLKLPNDLKRGTGCPKCKGNYRRSHSEFVNEISKIHPNIKVVGQYKNAQTKIMFECLDHNYEFISQPMSLLAGHHGCKECNLTKQLSTKVSKGLITDPKQLPEFEIYKRAVWRYSNLTYKTYLSGQTRDRLNHLDHILSIVDGFKNNIDPKILGSVHNLRIISGTANRIKSYKSDMTAEQLLNKWKENA